MEEKRKEKRINHPFWGLILMVVLTMVATWVLPAGEYNRIVNEAGKTVVDPNSYHLVPKNPAGIKEFFESFYHGYLKASGVMAVVTFIGGAFGVLKGIGILDAAVKSLTKKMENKSFILLAGTIMAAIAAHHSFTGMRELDVVFVALIVPICLKMGYDTMTGVAIVFLGSFAGFSAALANPFFTGIAHEIAQLRMYSGMWYRFIVLIFFFVTGLIFLVNYAKKVKEDPTKSACLDIEEANRKRFLEAEDNKEEKVLTTREKLAGFTFLGIFIFMVYGCMKLNFGFAQLGGCFFAMTLLTGFVAGRSLNDICYLMTDGIREVLVAILIIFFARSVLVIMEDAKIIDTVIHFLSRFVKGSNAAITSMILYILQCIINFFIPSGSGQAVITMPIVTPLADMGGITRQVVCLASQLGDGMTNYIYPTNGTLLAALSVAGLSFTHWFKFIIKIYVFWTVGAALLVALGQIINLA
ncbi:MAG: AbgT family transporter [Fusobacterium perfoetens]|uniref:YfcC family protein n=1 Tax=Fusobacterium perfoetens TaxID=852 RepID=UPI0023F420B4|nr:AbgT family transporter [Fusobacterium perfoetens]MCI6153253.1 AbgT family transporter [Fusobacterium perfoetens]MDY3238354.1 AbgT family transporter [Fusobacterium perfoetens]